MIFGIFKGNPLPALQRKAERIEQMKAEFRENKQKAIADTTAGIQELQVLLKDLMAL